MNIYEIKRRTIDNQPYFFTRATMRFFRQTLKDFSVRKYGNDGKYIISAPMRIGNTIVGYTERIFDPETNNLEALPEKMAQK